LDGIDDCWYALWFQRKDCGVVGRRKKEFEVWREEEREKWRGVVVVGILNGGVRGGKGGKRVRFMDGMEGESKDQVEVEYNS
jgi:hypothetical protein